MSYKSTILKQITLLVLLYSISFFAEAQNFESDFEVIVNRLISQRTSNYDTIHFYLNVYERDTVKMNYLVKKSARSKYKEGESYGLHGIGGFLVNKSLFKKAIPIHEKGLILAKECENDILQILHLNKLGAANRRTAKIKTAIDYYQESMAIVEKINDPSYEMLINLGRTLNSMGSAHVILEQYGKGIEFYEKALKIHESLGYKLGLAINNQNIGYANEKLGNLDTATAYYEKSLNYNEDIDSDLGRVICKNSLGQIYIKKGEYKKAEDIISPLIPIIRKTEDQFHIASVIINYGWVSLKLNNLEPAEEYLTEGLRISKKFDLQYSLVQVYELLSDLEISKGNNKKAIEFYKKSVSQNKKVINDQNISYLNDLTEQYNNEKKDKEITEQKLALSQSKSKTRVMSILIVSLLSASILLWFLYQQRQKRKNQEIITLKKEQQVRTLESLMEGEEKERMRIAQELHDGVNVDLSAIKYKLTSLLEKNNIVINEAVLMIDKSCEQVRAISHNLIPPSLKDFSLIETIEDFCTTTNGLHKPAILFNHIGEAVNISKKAEVNIFRIVQELVNNSVKHADATEITVQISHRDQSIQLTVEDNGVGFDKETITGNGIGLKNIQSRVDYLNAKLDFNSTKKGTSYIIDINTDNLV